jgi:transposase
MMVRPAGASRPVEDGAPPVQPLVPRRRVGAGVRRADLRPEQPVPDDRQHHHTGTPAGSERKRGAQDQALGRSRGGLTTKVHLLADALGRPLKLIVTAGQVGDITQAPALLDGQAGGAVLADKAYDSNALRAAIASMGAKAVIPSNRCRRVAIAHDATAYKLRNQIERCFGRLKHFRRFATRYERRTIHFSGFAHLAAAMIWLR